MVLTQATKLKGLGKLFLPKQRGSRAAQIESPKLRLDSNRILSCNGSPKLNEVRPKSAPFHLVGPRGTEAILSGNQGNGTFRNNPAFFGKSHSGDTNEAVLIRGT
jgi:hypothetical protein